MDRAACESVGVVGSIAARRQHGSECLLPRGNAAAVRCAPCVPAAVPGCVLHQGSFVRLLPAYPVSTQQPSLRHPASRAALPAGWAARGALQTPLGRPRRCAAALSSAILSWAERAPVLRVYSFGSESVLHDFSFWVNSEGVTRASSRALSSFGVSLATVQTFTLDSAFNRRDYRASHCYA